MSRYIDADAMIARASQDSERLYLESVARHTPSIDIVRCQDCKYWVYNFNGCARNPCTEPWYATDFCNYGERKESE
jgi:hypothetical protein